MIDWLSLIQTLGGIVGGLGLGMFTKSGRVKSQSDAYKAMAEAYEYRINALHEVVAKCNDTEKMHAQRISELNTALNDKIDQIRKLTDELIVSERKANEVNDRLTDEQEKTARLERQLGEANVLIEHYKAWHCRKADCADREPPNPTLKGMQYEHPKRKELCYDTTIALSTQ